MADFTSESVADMKSECLADLLRNTQHGRHRQQVGPCQAMMAAELLGQPSGIFALAGCIAAKHTKDRSQSLSIGRREISHTTLLGVSPASRHQRLLG